MPMLIGDSVLHPDRGAVEIERVVSTLQSGHGGPGGLGIWAHPVVTSDFLRTDTVGAVWTAGASSNCDLGYTLIGDSMILNLIIGVGILSALSAACAALFIKIPDGYQGKLRQTTAGNTVLFRHPVVVVDSGGAGVQVINYATILGSAPNWVQISPPIGAANWTGPGIQVSGQIIFEYAKPVG